MASITTSESATPRLHVHPGWLRITRTPLGATERAALAARHGIVRSAADVAAVLRDRALAEEVECLYVLALNPRLRLVGVEEVARGSCAGAATTPREVFRLAVVLGAFAVILAHNHPSGEPLPSEKDVDITRRMVAAGEVLGIEVLDHVVLAGGPATRTDWFFGFRDRGLVFNA